MIKDDPDLAEAMEMFAGMSPEEMTETLAEVAAMLANDDPETAAVLKEAMEEVSKMSAGEMKQSISDMVEEADVMHAVAETLEALNDADESTWEKILDKKDVILENVIKSGHVSEGEAKRFKDNPSEWENELGFIWKELRKQEVDHEEEL